jgi:hypothetical protein
MTTLRSFLYLDDYKLHSFASQAGTSRDGPPQFASVAQARVFEDGAFIALESKLQEVGKLVTVTAAESTHLAGASFIRVTGPATFTDVAAIKGHVEQFYKIGQAITYVSGYAEVNQEITALRDQVARAKTGSEKGKLMHRIQELQSQTAKAAEFSGLRMDPDFLSSLSMLLEYGFGGDLQLRVTLNGEGPGETLQFDAPLDRRFLREADASLVRKYARKTQKPLTMVGVVTQAGEVPPAPANPSLEGANMKQAVTQMVDGIAGVEGTFFGRRPHEIVVDPIAVYREL